MRVGLLGGTFNPPHLGHLRLAEIALEELALDEVRFVPTAVPPHKPLASGLPDGPDRLRLLERALAGTGRPFRVEPLEVLRGGTSYTVDTLEALAAREPDCAWIFLMGSDQVPGFPGWRRPERVLELASLGVAPRPGSADAALPDLLAGRVRPRWSGTPGEFVWLTGTHLDLASTDLRAALGAGRSPEGDSASSSVCDSAGKKVPLDLHGSSNEP